MSTRTKYVTIESPGKIPALGGLLGPITTPCYLDIDIIIGLINSGKAVYEVNPTNIREKTRLSRVNVLKYIYNYPTRNQHKTNGVKASDVGMSPALVEPSTVKTTIVPETGEGMIGTDIFVSNKHS
jgi:hypothetical protein